jgi:hypothetical protein
MRSVLLMLFVAAQAGVARPHGPVIVSTRTPFLADTTGGVPADRRFAATVLTVPARVPAAWPLVIEATMMVDGDPLKGPLGDVRCAPAIDGVRAVPIPVPQPAPVPAESQTGRGEVADLAPALPPFPNLLWQGTFDAGPIPPGRHAFTLECDGSSPFRIRGTASLRVTGNPSRRNDR